jgi:carbon-monoxide dehydrogenase large subunit
VKALVTNKTPSGTYRGPGRYEANFFRERLIEMAASDLRLESAEFRLRNLVRPAQMPYAIGRLVPYEGEAEYDSGDYPRALLAALEKIDYRKLSGMQGRLIDGRYHGIGIACFVDSSGAGPAEHARLCVRSAEQFELCTGTSSSGQGHETTFAQILADEIQVPISHITVLHGSTTLLPEGVGTYHGRGLVMGGSAVKLAGRQFVQEFIAEAARQRDVNPEQLKYERGVVVDRVSGAVALTLQELCALAAGGSATATRVLQVDAKFEQTKLTYEYGTQIAHVAVNPLTAQVDVLRMVTVEDCGNPVNPLIVHGQVLGACVQGLGGAFLEEFSYDESGQMTSGSFADYLLPTSTDFPNVEAYSVSFAPSTLNPLGAKGVGEGGIEGAGAAAGNAVSNALRSLGVEIRSLPISPNKLASLIRDACVG